MIQRFWISDAICTLALSDPAFTPHTQLCILSAYSTHVTEVAIRPNFTTHVGLHHSFSKQFNDAIIYFVTTAETVLSQTCIHEYIYTKL